MRILLVSNLYPPHDVGGYERLARQVGLGLLARGHELKVLTSGYGVAADRPPECGIRRSLRLLADESNIYAPLPAPPAQIEAISRHNAATLAQAIGTVHPDVVFVWNLYFLDRSMLVPLAPLGRRAVYLLTDNWLISFLRPAFLEAFFATEVQRTGARRRWWRGQEHPRRHGFERLPGSAIFPSRFMADLHRRAGILLERETLVPHGIPEDGIPVPRSRRELVRPGELRLLCAGRVVPVKGVHTALEALPEIAARLPALRVSLDVVGDQRDRAYCAQLEARISALGMGGSVRFLAPVPEADLPALFQAYDVYVFPSLYEPFALTLIHALRAGIPVVASTAGGTGDLIRNRATGLTFAPADARGLARGVVALALDPRLREACSDGGRRVGARPSPTRCSRLPAGLPGAVADT